MFAALVPQVTVQRKPYWLVLHNGCSIRDLNLTLFDNTNNVNANGVPGVVYVVGSDGGLRVTPTTAEDSIIVSNAERYMVRWGLGFQGPGLGA